jgi:hypothetical protein
VSADSEKSFLEQVYLKMGESSNPFLHQFRAKYVENSVYNLPASVETLWIDRGTSYDHAPRMAQSWRSAVVSQREALRTIIVELMEVWSGGGSG